MKDLWVTTKELSLIFGIAQQNVRKKAVVQHYTTRYVHGRGRGGRVRSEEHTSELQSH